MARTRKVIIISLLVLIIILFFPTKIFATDLYVDSEIKLATGVIDPDNFRPSDIDNNEIEPIINQARIIIQVIRVIGVVVAVVTLMVIGIKYMTGSVSEKAEYKKTMIPYLIGAFIFFALSQLIPIIIEFASGLETT